MDTPDLDLITHDGRRVYPVGAPLPEGALGWTLCMIGPGATATWIAAVDMPRAKESRLQNAARVTELRTKNAARLELELVGKHPHRGATLADMREMLLNVLNERAWPLRLAKEPK
jgi:hypothetical protein